MKFIEDEDFVFTQCPAIAKERPEMLTSSFYFQLFEGYGPHSESRHLYLDTLFDKIIDF